MGPSDRGGDDLAGGFLYWHDLHGRSVGDFVGTSFGLWLTIGAAAALVAFGIGMFATAPTLKRMLAVGGQIAQAEGAPPPELVTELGSLQARGRALAKMNLAFVSIAAFSMSTARYW